MLFMPENLAQNKHNSLVRSQFLFFFNKIEVEARVGIEPTHKGFADLSLTTWVPRLWGSALLRTPVCLRKSVSQTRKSGAGDRGRTGDIFLGKEALYH